MTGGDLLDNIDIPVGIEAGVMRAEVLAVAPAFRLFMHREAVQHLLGPFRIPKAEARAAGTLLLGASSYGRRGFAPKFREATLPSALLSRAAE